MRAWSGAVTSVQRRFRVRGSVGPPLVASCGFAEGCGLSVLAMAVVDVALHQAVSNASPAATIHSFVDDWQTVACDFPTWSQADQAVQQFAGSWDMELDPAKAIAWATTTQDRALLRSQGARVVLDARNLGGHCSYSRRCTNYTVTQRIKSMAGMWTKLARSCAPYERKVSALMTVAWPRGLHGAEAVNLGEKWLAGLRTRAMEGIGCRKPGANPLLQLGLISPTSCDPGYKLLESSVMACRSWGSKETIQGLLDDNAVGAGMVKTGPAWVLLRRMVQVGISWCPTVSSFQDQLGELDVWNIPIQELQFRLRVAWHDWIAERVGHRPGFQGLHRCDPMTARSLCSNMSADSRALVHIALNGTFWTEDHLYHISEADSPRCRWCAARDGCYHRIWCCPHFAAVRAQVFARHPGSNSYAQPETMPECQAQHAWPCEPPELRRLWRRLIQLPDTCHVRQPFAAGNALHLFTDGACLLPAVPQLRLAAWAVCSAVPLNAEPVIVAGGPLAGLVQTAFRAELSAVLAAILVAISRAKPCWVYCDCQGVVDRVQGYMQGFPRPTNRGRNSDLWQRIFDAVQQAGPLLRAIVKVRAHQDPAQAVDQREAWLRHNNHLVDRAADALNKAREPEFQELWERVRKGWVLESLRAQFVLDLHKSIAMAAVGSVEPSRPLGTDPGVRGKPVLSCPVAPNEELGRVSSMFGYQFVQVLSNWIRLHCHAGAGQQARWISMLQILVLFNRDTGLQPPLFHSRSRRWVIPGFHPEADLIEVDMGRRLQWWNRCFKAVVQAHGGSCHFEETRPFSTTLLIRMQSVVVE